MEITQEEKADLIDIIEALLADAKADELTGLFLISNERNPEIIGRVSAGCAEHDKFATFGRVVGEAICWLIDRTEREKRGKE